MTTTCRHCFCEVAPENETQHLINHAEYLSVVEKLSDLSKSLTQRVTALENQAEKDRDYRLEQGR